MGLPAPKEVFFLTREELDKHVQEEVQKELAKIKADNERLMTTREVAAYLAVAPQCIRTMVSRDGLPSIKYKPRKWGFRRSEVEEWLTQKSTRPHANRNKHLLSLSRLKAIKTDS